MMAHSLKCLLRFVNLQGKILSSDVMVMSQVHSGQAKRFADMSFLDWIRGGTLLPVVDNITPRQASWYLLFSSKYSIDHTVAKYSAPLIILMFLLRQ
jgi:hypothetical protein